MAAMTFNINEVRQVLQMMESLGRGAVTLIVIDPYSEILRGSSALFALADNVVSVREDGSAVFLKHRQELP